MGDASPLRGTGERSVNNADTANQNIDHFKTFTIEVTWYSPA